MSGFRFPLLLCALALAAPAMAQQDVPSMSASEKTQKQTANEEAEQLCKAIKDPDKFNECLDLYFLDAGKFKAFLEQNGIVKPTKPAK
ncbi:MAG: hypothetical protein ACOVN0_09490 [Niveispirillum sp.]|uniref:hypothetical protein n=1 Tax=Niveispirillum sp. TaxID=1917217 RepID=UPI003BA5AA2B